MRLDATVTVLLLCGFHASQTVEVYDQCKDGMVTANQCIQDGINAGIATDCNWYVVIPFVQQCIYPAIQQCNAAYVLTIDEQITQLNVTLNSPQCNPDCTDQAVRLLKTSACRITNQYDVTVTEVNGGDTSNCQRLSNYQACISEVNNGCPALQQIAVDEAIAMGTDNALRACNYEQFSPPTTVSPLPAELDLVNGVLQYKDNNQGSDDVTTIIPDTGGEDNAGFPLIYGLCIGLGILGLIIILIACVWVCRSRDRRNKKRPRDISDMESSRSWSRTSSTNSRFQPPTYFNSRQFVHVPRHY